MYDSNHNVVPSIVIGGPVKRRLARSAIAILFASLMAVSVPAASHAAVVENGTVSCSGKYGWVKHRVQGPTRAVLAPGLSTSRTVYTYNLSSSVWYTGANAGAAGGGYWEVYSSTAIDNAYTSGYCQTFG